MADHYYTPVPQSEHKPAQFSAQYREHTLLFETDSGVFSRLAMDRGTAILLAALPDGLAGDALDMGCGYGALGLSLLKANPALRLTMADVNARAVALARENALGNGLHAETLESDGFAALAGRRFDLIVTNPPIRAGKAVIYRLFADAAAALAPGGALYLVVRKQQGAPSAKAYLETLYAHVAVTVREAGYWVLRCDAPLAQAHAKANPHESE